MYFGFKWVVSSFYTHTLYFKIKIRKKNLTRKNIKTIFRILNKLHE